MKQLRLIQARVLTVAASIGLLGCGAKPNAPPAGQQSETAPAGLRSEHTPNASASATSSLSETGAPLAPRATSASNAEPTFPARQNAAQNGVIDSTARSPTLAALWDFLNGVNARYATQIDLTDYNYWELTGEKLANELGPRLPAGELAFAGTAACLPSDTPGLYTLQPRLDSLPAGAARPPKLRLQFMEFQVLLPEAVFKTLPTPANLQVSFRVHWAIGYVRDSIYVKRFFVRPKSEVKCVGGFTALDFGNYGEAVRVYFCADPKEVKVLLQGKYAVAYHPLEKGSKDLFQLGRERNFWPRPAK